MSWYYNSDNGGVQDMPSALAWLDLHAGLGWHGPFATKQDALNFYTQNAPQNPGWKAPAGLGANITNSLGTDLGNLQGKSTGNLPSLTGWTHNIEQWVIRGFEMILGIGLIVVALAKLASGTPAGRAAVKAGKAAAIL